MRVEENANEVVVDLKSFKLPGWVWIAGAAIILYLARTYITDSGLVELIGIGVYMVLKYAEVQYSKEDVEGMAGWVGRIYAEINRWRARSAAETRPQDVGPTMRSGSTEVAKPVEIKQPNSWTRWMFD